MIYWGDLDATAKHYSTGVGREADTDSAGLTNIDQARRGFVKKAHVKYII